MPERMEITLPIRCSTARWLKTNVAYIATALWGGSSAIAWIWILVNHVDITYPMLQYPEANLGLGMYLIFGLLLDILAAIAIVALIAIICIEWVATRIPKFKCIKDEPEEH